MDWNSVNEAVAEVGQFLGRIGSGAWLAFIIAGLFAATHKKHRSSHDACGKCGAIFAPGDYRVDVEVWKCTGCGARLVPEWDATGPMQ